MYIRKNAQGHKEVFLETPVERLRFQNLRLSVTSDPSAEGIARTMIQQELDRQETEYLKTLALRAEAIKDYESKSWWYKFTNYKPSNFMPAENILIGWTWFWMAHTNELDYPPGVLTLEEFNALQLYEMNKDVKPFIAVVFITKDDQESGYSDFINFFGRFKSLDGVSYESWGPQTLPKKAIGYKHTISQ